MMNLIILSWFRCQNHFRVPYESAKTCAGHVSMEIYGVKRDREVHELSTSSQKKLSHQETTNYC